MLLVTRGELLWALLLVAGIFAMVWLGLRWADQQGRSGLVPPGTVREVIP